MRFFFYILNRRLPLHPGVHLWVFVSFFAVFCVSALGHCAVQCIQQPCRSVLADINTTCRKGKLAVTCSWLTGLLPL